MKGNKPLITIVFLSGLLVLFFAIYVKRLEKQANMSEQVNSMTQQGNIAEPAKTPQAVSALDHIKGNKEATVTVIEYSDFQCTECKTIQPTIDKIMQVYGKKIRFVTRFLPLPQHENTAKESEAAECAGEIGGENAYWKYSRSLFDNSTAISTGIGLPMTKLTPLAVSLGLDINKFNACINGGKFSSRVEAQKADGNSIGIHLLPSMVVIDSQNNPKMIVGNQPYEVYKLVLDMALL